jgi:hypothetical protein
MLTKLFRPKATVEQIHEEFDSAERKIIEQCETLLRELNIPTEAQLERKALKLRELGFVSSETVKRSETLNNRKVATEKQLSLINQYKVTYPLDKFITINELNRICEKYDLIHAPVSSYIKDVPEKNVLEMVNRKPLKDEDKLGETITLIANDSENSISGLTDAEEKELREIGITLEVDIEIHLMIELGSINKSRLASLYYGKPVDFRLNYFGNETVIHKDMSGLFIAAPKSHFSLSGLSKTSQFGFFKTHKIEVKDPVVFEYCKGDICRIVTKWGTDDDQSYLDPIVNNEQLN